MLTTILLCTVALAPGKLFLSGGGSTPPEIPKRFIEACGGPASLIVVLPQSSADATSSKGSENFLREHGSKNVWTFQVNEVTAEKRKEVEAKLKEAKGIWVGGGVQGRFVERFGKKWLDEFFKPLIKNGANYYGTSAGAMLCSDPMIEGPDGEGKARTGSGIGLTKWVVDSHFRQRNREPRLRHALEKTGQRFGLGISEKEWVVIVEDRILEKHGDPLEIQLKTK